MPVGILILTEFPFAPESFGMRPLFRWTPNVRSERITGMATTNISERDGHGRSSEVGPRDTDGGPRPSCAARLSGLLLLAVAGIFLFLSRTLGANVRFANWRRGQVLDGYNRVAKR